MSNSFDAPQADRLDLVRRVVEVVSGGGRYSSEIAARARVAPRYARYALHAARLLGLLSADSEAGQVTQVGEELLSTGRGSAAEREVLTRALRMSPALSMLAEAVLGPDEPSRTELAEALLESQSGRLSTALRRAGTLIAWRRYLAPSEGTSQLDFEALEWSAEPEAAPAAPANLVEQPALHDEDAVAVPVEDTQPAPAIVVVAASAGESSAPLPDTIVSPVEPTSDATDEQPDASSANDAIATISPSDDDAQPSLLDDNTLAYMRRQVEQAQLVLFTGAGFSLGAFDVTGERLPAAAAFAREVWDICYPGQEYDGSTLQDLFEHAQRRHAKKLDELLRRRFTVESGTLPSWYETWFEFPWAKIYTLNVDDLEDAAQRRFTLPRALRSISALRDSHTSSAQELDVIRLNGSASDGADGVTFSVDQFSQRLARQEPFYAQLAAETLTRPFVFVGSPIDEPLFWQHVQIRGMRSLNSESELRPRSFLVSPSLNAGRIDKLRAYNIVWVRATAEAFARRVLADLQIAAEKGRRRLGVLSAIEAGDERNIVEIADVADEATRRTEFLLGEEPTWADIRTGRAIDRDEDVARLQHLRDVALSSRPASDPVPIFAVAGTAGAGKTTLLMKVGLRLHAEGLRVAWVDADSELHPRALTRYYRGEAPPPVLIIDDAGRYGAQLVSVLRDLNASDVLRLVVLGVRAHHASRLEGPGADDLDIEEDAIGRLTDPDIDRLLQALDREKRLGALRGKPIEAQRNAFRERAERQIIVAMIEATSGEKFEEKIVREWQDQDAICRYVYALVALATTNSYPMLLQEILLASAGGTHELEAVRKLHQGHLLTEDDQKRYRVRHRVIAEKLVDELVSRGTQVEKLVVGLCRALSSPPRSRRQRRVLKHLLSHDRLLRLLNDVESARAVYAELEAYLDDDHHFWLQRGCLELEEGDVRFAENFLEQAAQIDDSDPLVETAYAHMQLRKAVANPAAPSAQPLVDEAFETLRRLIATRGRIDRYPAHVFGSQTLAWCRRAGLVPRVRLALLREAKEVVAAAAGMHRGRPELQQLVRDLRREELTPH